VEYGYDPAGNLAETKVFNAKGKQVNGQTLETNDSYQLVRWLRFDAPETTLQYDPNGNITEIKQGNLTTGFEYDALNRLIAVTTPEGQRLTYTYAPGERSLIEQYEHARVLVADLRDTGFTFSPALSTASRPLIAPYGTVRFSETLGTFQLANADGSEITRPHENIEGGLMKLHLLAPDSSPATARGAEQNEFNIPFNTAFMPAEYLTINCCPTCCTDPDMTCFPRLCRSCTPTPPAPTLTGMSPSSAAANNAGFGVILNGTFNDASEQVNIAPSGITATAATVNPDGTASTTFQLSSSPVAGQYNVSVTDSGGTSNQLTFNLLPVITGIDPNPIMIGSNNVQLTIDGVGFGASPQVNLPQGFTNQGIGSTNLRIVVTVNVGFNATIGNNIITVTANGQGSNRANLVVDGPNQLVVQNDVIGFCNGCSTTVERNTTYEVLNFSGVASTNIQLCETPNITGWSCNQQFPGVNAIVCGTTSFNLPANSQFTDQWTLASDSFTPAGCGDSLTDQWKWIASPNNFLELGSLNGFAHTNAISINGSVMPPQANAIPAGTVIPH
jgi:hypothetical protein